MSIFDRLSTFFGLGQSAEFRQMLNEPVVEKFEWVDDIGNTTSILANLVGGGKGPGDAATLAAYTAVPTLRQTVGRVAETVGAARWRLYVSSSSAQGVAMARRLRSMKATTPGMLKARREAIAKSVEAGDLREVEVHPYLDLLEKANDSMTGLSFRELTQVYVDSVGESFWEIERGEADLPIALWPINPTRVKKVPMPGDTSDEAKFEISMSNGQTQFLDAADVIWMRKINPSDPYGRGKGIAQALADEVDADEQAAKQIVSFFANNSIPSAVVNLKGAAEDAVKAARVGWEQNHGGATRSNKLHFTNAEDMQIMQMSSAFKDSQMIDVREFENKMLRQTFGVPPEIVGISENSNRATIWGAESIFGKFVLVPRLEFLRTEQQVWLLPQYPQGERLILEYDSPLPPDQELRAEVMRDHPYAYSVNEIRALSGDDPVEGEAGSARWIPSSGELMTIDDALADDAADEPDEQGDDDDALDDVAQEDEKSLGKCLTSWVKTFGLDPLAAAESALDLTDLTDHTNPVMEKLVEEWGQDAIDTLGVGMVFNVGNTITMNHLAEQAGVRMAWVNETSRKLLGDSLAVGVGAGEGIPELRKRVSEVFAGFSRARTETIARTEVINSANFARMQGFEQTGLVQRKKWLATKDNRTRHDHRRLNGQVKKLNERFVLKTKKGDVTTMRPGAFGIPEQDINCRCTVIPVVDNKTTAEERIQQQIEDAYDAWEKIFADALDRGFAQQRSRVLRVFE